MAGTFYLLWAPPGRKEPIPAQWEMLAVCQPPTPPHRLPLWVCFPLETISEASDMKEAMEIMPETLEYGIINARVLHFLKDVLCQVNGGRGRALGVCETGGGRPLRSWRVQVAGRAPAPGGVPVLCQCPSRALGARGRASACCVVEQDSV